VGLDFDDLLGNRQGLLRDLAGVDGDVNTSHLFGLSLLNGINVLEESISFKNLIVFSLEARRSSFSALSAVWEILMARSRLWSAAAALLLYSSWVTL